MSKDSYWFQNLLRARLNHGFNCLLLISGMAGIGKSFSALTLAEEMDPSFSIERVVFTSEEYLGAMNGIQRGQFVVIDEPAQSEVLSSHSWWAETQRALADCLESNRYLGVGTILATINRGLLDSLVRNYLLHFMVNCTARGRGVVYEIRHSPFDSSETTPRLGQLWFGLPSPGLVEEYEAKRHLVMAGRYADRGREIESGKVARKTFSQLVKDAKDSIESLKGKDGKILDSKIRLVCNVGWKRASHIRSILENE